MHPEGDLDQTYLLDIELLPTMVEEYQSDRVQRGSIDLIEKVDQSLAISTSSKLLGQIVHYLIEMIHKRYEHA